MNTSVCIKNPIFKEEDLYLELDYENITNEEYSSIIIILKVCPSFVNQDIINISKEIIKRLRNEEITANKQNINTIRILYSLLKNISGTDELQIQIKKYYGCFIKSPVTTPVSAPKIMRKVSRKKSNVCPC